MKNAKIDDEIEIDDLLVDGEEIEVKDTQTYDVFKEDVNELLLKSNKQKKQNDFFRNLPKTESNSKFEQILKRQTQQNEKMLQKKLKIEFDKKMARINKIKSKSYKKALRKEKQKQNIDLYEELSFSNETESSVKEESSQFEINPEVVVGNKTEQTETKKENRKNVNVMEEMFRSSCENEEEDSFIKEKVEVMNADAPTVEEIILPGFDGEWAGAGIETKKSKINTIKKVKEGIPIQDRIDFNKSNIIINENITYTDKYSSNLPYGYTEEMYKKKLKMDKRPDKISTDLVGDEIECKKLKDE